MHTLSFAGLHYTYPETASRALDGVDLEISSGLTLLTGSSGSGKSTLLRVCNGLIPHFHGGVIGGSACVLGRGEMLRRVGDALEMCGIAHLRSRAVGTLSGGERQRLALAGVLAMRPRLLVLDEPLSQLDPEGSAALLAAL